MNKTNLIMFFLGASCSSLIDPRGNCEATCDSYRSRGIRVPYSKCQLIAFDDVEVDLASQFQRLDRGIDQPQRYHGVRLLERIHQLASCKVPIAHAMQAHGVEDQFHHSGIAIHFTPPLRI